MEASDTLNIFSNLMMALMLALTLAWLSIPIARRIGLMDRPGSAPHKQHQVATPLAGGIALFLALLLTEWVSGGFEFLYLRITFIAALPVFILGLIDDYKTLSPSVKLSGQILAAFLLIYQGVTIRVFESPEFFIHGNTWLFIGLDWILTIVWIIGITNALNFIDSMDGLAVGVGGVAAAFFMLVSLDAQQTFLVHHSALIIGACLGLYLFNSPPAMLFLGDSGSQTLGFILAVLAIQYNPIDANQASSWIVPILLLGVPIFDTCLVVYSRWRRKRPIYLAGLDHTYHRLIRMGIQSQRAVLIMHIVSLFLGSLAILVLKQHPIIANTIFAAIILLSAWMIIFLVKQED